MLVTTGISWGMSVGLEALGVDPMVAGLISSVVSGGVNGFLGPNGGLGMAFKSALEMGSYYGMNLLGQHFDVDPVITSILSMSTAALTGAAIDPNVTLQKALGSITENVIGELAYYGVETAGRAIGLDPEVSYLAGIAIRSSLRAGFSDGQDPGAFLQGALMGAVQGRSGQTLANIARVDAENLAWDQEFMMLNGIITKAGHDMDAAGYEIAAAETIQGGYESAAMGMLGAATSFAKIT